MDGTAGRHKVLDVTYSQTNRSSGRSSPLNIVNAFGVRAFPALGEIGGKSNEITEMPALLELLDISGSTVTADAMHMRRETMGESGLRNRMDNCPENLALMRKVVPNLARVTDGGKVTSMPES